MSNNLVFKLKSVTVADSPLTLQKLTTEAANEIEKLTLLIKQLLPFMLNDMEGGLDLGNPPFDIDHCKNKDDLCGDCTWFKEASYWKRRLDAGHFKDFM